MKNEILFGKTIVKINPRKSINVKFNNYRILKEF